MALSFPRGLAAVVAVAAVVAGCGGSDGGGGTPTGAGGTTGGGTGTLTWKENGGAHSALTASAARVKSANLDIVQIAGGESSGTGIAFGVGLMAPPLVAGSYACSDSGMDGRIVSMSYGSGGSNSAVPTACSIVISLIGDTAGTHVVGTFSATLPLENGITKTLTDGRFDLVLTVNSI